MYYKTIFEITVFGSLHPSDNLNESFVNTSKLQCYKSLPVLPIYYLSHLCICVTYIGVPVFIRIQRDYFECTEY